MDSASTMPVTSTGGPGIPKVAENGKEPAQGPRLAHQPATKPKFPPSRLVDAFNQVVEPLITEITCLRSHELRLFHLVSAYIGSLPGELRTKLAKCRPVI
jgi:hypothetical protein